MKTPNCSTPLFFFLIPLAVGFTLALHSDRYQNREAPNKKDPKLKLKTKRKLIIC